MKRILVIEDAPDIRGIISETLASNGWEALLAEDGEQGVALANKEMPDLILCDIRMPKMDGYAVLQELRKSPNTAMVPFVFLSGLGERPQIRQGMELGADDYLLKPFSPSELIAAVEARFRKQKVISQSTEQKLNDLRESLSFALPHEFGTPLNTILGFSSLIAEATELKANEIREYAGYIHSSGERLRALIEKFLLFAQLELISSDPAQIKVLSQKAPAPTKETVVMTGQRIAQEKQRSSDLVLDVSEIEHGVGAAHLERMIREVVENACHFSAPGSAVEIVTEEKRGNFRIRITDHGKGLTTEQLSRVTANLQFDRRLQEQQGAGLGLAITRKLAELYGGSVEIRSIPGKETSVLISLPL
jgi:two-component system sensor histidine kinase/response regulator